jgi:PIN domain nuclease of toxin-antitoxin system
LPARHLRVHPLRPRQKGPHTLEIIEEAWSLPESIHRDPADRILIASSRTYRIPVITTESLILTHPHVEASS